MTECTRLALWFSILVSQVVAARADAASHGETQLALVMRDRPELAAILAAHAELRNWAVAEFETESGGSKLLWDPAEPVSGRAAEHEYPSRSGKVAKGTAAIRVSARLTGWDQLTGLVFELHNFKGNRRFEEIHTAAVNGTIDKSAYVRQCLEQEFVAQAATKAFLATRVAILPGAGSDASRLFWQKLNSEDTLDAHLLKYKARGYDLAAHYEKLYVQEVVPELARPPR